MNDNEFVKENANDNPMNQSTGGIQLPFPTLYMSWHSGDKNLIDLGADNVKYSGGWKIDEEKLKFFNDAMNTPDYKLPATWKPAVMQGDEPYNVFLKKNIAISFIGIRERNVAEVDGRIEIFPRFTKGTKSHMQMLVLLHLGDLTTPAVISSKSTSAGRIKDCISKEYVNATKELREKWGIPYYRMWIDLGIDKPDFVDPSFGKADKPRLVSLCKLLSYPTSEAELKATYIGKDLIAYTDDLKIKAQEWLNDVRWKTGKEPVQNNVALDEEDMPF